MCLLCELKRLNASEEIVKLVTPLFNAALNVLEICADVKAKDKSIFAMHEDTMQELSDCIVHLEPSVTVISIVKEDGESMQDAINRALGMAKKELIKNNANETKH